MCGELTLLYSFSLLSIFRLGLFFAPIQQDIADNLKLMIHFTSRAFSHYPPSLISLHYHMNLQVEAIGTGCAFNDNNPS